MSIKFLVLICLISYGTCSYCDCNTTFDFGIMTFHMGCEGWPTPGDCHCRLSLPPGSQVRITDSFCNVQQSPTTLNFLGAHCRAGSSDQDKCSASIKLGPLTSIEKEENQIADEKESLKFLESETGVNSLLCENPRFLFNLSQICGGGAKGTEFYSGNYFVESKYPNADGYCYATAHYHTDDWKWYNCAGPQKYSPSNRFCEHPSRFFDLTQVCGSGAKGREYYSGNYQNGQPSSDGKCYAQAHYHTDDGHWYNCAGPQVYNPGL